MGGRWAAWTTETRKAEVRASIMGRMTPRPSVDDERVLEREEIIFDIAGLQKVWCWALEEDVLRAALLVEDTRDREREDRQGSKGSVGRRVFYAILVVVTV